MRTKWRVTLYNQFAQCGIYGEGSTRRAAFDAAYKKAGYPFLAYKIKGYAVTWLGAFNDASAYMRRGDTSATHDTRHGACVEIRRVTEEE